MCYGVNVYSLSNKSSWLGYCRVHEHGPEFDVFFRSASLVNSVFYRHVALQPSLGNIYVTKNCQTILFQSKSKQMKGNVCDGPSAGTGESLNLHLQLLLDGHQTTSSIAFFFFCIKPAKCWCYEVRFWQAAVGFNVFSMPPLMCWMYSLTRTLALDLHHP